jgi:hypothetical protein
MKRIANKAIKGERGQALIMTLILLLLGGLIITPLLNFMDTGLDTGRVYEEDMNELYAADSGVEDALQQIITDAPQLPSPTNPLWSYSIADVNGKDVTITITYIDDTTYKITSTAGNTQIDAFVTVSGDYSGILYNVITSQGDYILRGPTTVDPPEGEEHGPVANYDGDWPTAGELASFYIGDVEGHTYSAGTLDVKNYVSGIGPIYREGTLSIQNSGAAGLTVPLNDTLYITGDTEIGKTGQNFTIDLNGQTIFIESDALGNDYALNIGGKCTFTGSGCIIVIGNIEFKPNLSSSSDDFTLVMSVTGKTYMQPNGDFYGSLAGSTEVYIQNGSVNWGGEDGVGDLNFPGVGGEGGGGGGSGYQILTWEIS